MQSDTRHYHWLRNRKISDSVLDMFGISVGDHGTLKDAIILPILNEDGDLAFNKYRRDPIDDRKPKYVYDRGGTLTLFGAFHVKHEPRVLITEGELDALVAWSFNIPAVSSTGGAMSFSERWVPFFAGKEVFVCFDSDEAGGKGMARIWKMMPWVKCVFLPDIPNIKDISDYASSGGDLNMLLSTGVSFPSKSDILDHRAQRIALFKNTYFHDAVIEADDDERKREEQYDHPKKKDDEVENAKAYPIPRLVDIGRDGKILCLWHNERTPSMHYFKKTNSLYCFGCGKHADAIDVYRHVNGCGFREAIRQLNKRP